MYMGKKIQWCEEITHATQAMEAVRQSNYLASY